MPSKLIPIFLLFLTLTTHAQPALPTHQFLVATDGDDSSAGEKSAPFKTINKALAIARPGDTILIQPGTYRESLNFKTSGDINNPITISAEKKGTVIIDGADVLTNWTREPEGKPIYSAPWDHDFFYAPGVRTHFGPKSDGATTAIGYAEQFIAVTPDDHEQTLHQVLHPHELVENTFCIDYDAKKVSIWFPNGADPQTLTVLGSARSTLAAPSEKTGTCITLKGLTFRHAANFAQRQAVRTGDNWTIEDCTIERCNAGGVGVTGSDVHLLRVTAQDNGQLGLGGSKNTNAILQDCISQRNNYKGFSPGNEAGGGKFTATTGLQLLNCSYRDNTGIGLWLDFKNKKYLIKGGSYTANHYENPHYMGAGIMIEISDGPGTIENARFADNTGPAIQIGESMKLTIQHNTFIHNYIDMREMKRPPYNVSDITITNNQFKDTFISTSLGNWPPESAQSKRITINQNTYDNPPGKPLAYWGTLRAINTLDEAKQKLGIESQGRLAPVSPNP